jgi:phosphoglycolate phosphatase
MLQFVVFDLDGTLVDSRTDIANAANATIESFGGTRISDEAIVGMVGEGSALLVRRALDAAGLDPDAPGALDTFIGFYEQHLLDHTVPYEGMTDALARLDGQVTMAVLTNKPQRASEHVLEGLGLRRFFRDVIGGDTALGRKPDPAGLFELMGRAGARPDTTLLVGDSPVDLETARRARTHVCLARYGFGYRFDAPDFLGYELFLDRPDDLPALLASARL